ncbi:sensor histidine kinase [Edaphobacter bradus]|uniref:sensor histidine kinase n=1 Tax=Edaphobacter bradus TaxID=2259016 RepID=UPI0021DFCA98|nr:HAMP domain-containing sensor histidine kinase [Edaphobacter bradus]
MKMRSLTRQAVLSVLVVELVCAIALTGAALLHERHTQVRAFDVMLKGRSDSLLGAIQDAEDPEDNVTIDPTELTVPKEDVYAVYNQGGRMLGASGNAPAEIIERRGGGTSVRRANGRSYRVLQRDGIRVIDRADYGGVGLRRPVTIVYAAPDHNLWHHVYEAVRFYVFVSALLIFGTAIAMIVLLRRVLRPIDELALEASTVSARSLQFTAPESASGIRELRPLADALTRAMEGLKRSFDQQHRFVGDAAHELKTAVAVVRSSIQLLMLRPRETGEYVDGLQALLKDNTRVEELVTRMLTLARLEERGSTEGARADLCEVADRVIHGTQSLADSELIEIQSVCSSSVVVPVPAEDLEILISNLLVNAIQHSKPGSEVLVSSEESDGRAIFRVKDKGEGISPSALPHLFERFFREDSSRSRQTGGAGLGLAICKTIVDAASGTISLESTPGTGTTVIVSLPLAADA